MYIYMHRGVDNFLGLWGGANKVKIKELQFSSRGRVWEEDVQKQKNFFKIQESKLE